MILTVFSRHLHDIKICHFLMHIRKKHVMSKDVVKDFYLMSLIDIKRMEKVFYMRQGMNDVNQPKCIILRVFVKLMP